MLVLGEVQTAALRHSGGMPSKLAETALALLAGERVRVFERPISHAVSPKTYTGVDCRIVARSGPKVRGVGTLMGRACLTGGRVLQGSTVARIDPVGGGHRRPWSHYLARLGVVEALGRADLPGILAAHLGADRTTSTMGMGAFCVRLLTEVQGSPALDQRPPLRTQRTVMRWAATVDGNVDPGAVRVNLYVREDGLRTLRVAYGTEPSDIDSVVELCEDLALHDWLLTALLLVIEQSQIGVEQPAQSVLRLRPAVDHLLHLWMPAARLGETAHEVWAELEARAGLSKQWEASVQRVRDQMAMAAALVNRPPEKAQLFR
ncbi:SCO2521 family protein [Actinoplanes sp. HUAS TT8]|uniref:SCO2521 family protein n=1 Tax=Actinoplanes sp. HUAS TT8 TaxID=3447453 RepID=UPI003F52202B